MWETRETWVQSLGWNIPWRREKIPTPIFWPREFHGPYSPWGRKKSDMTEQLSLHFTSHDKKSFEDLTISNSWIVYLERPSTSTQADLFAFSFSIAKLSSCCLAAKSCLTLLQNQVVKCFYLLMKNKSLVTTYRICVQFRWQEACKAFCTWTYSTKRISAAVTGAQLSLGIWGESIPAPQRQQNLRILKSLI